MKDTPENRVKTEVKDWLDVKGFFHYPNLQGLGSYKGIPDIVAIKDGIVLFIEIKAKTGKQSDYQIIFESDVVGAGGNYIVARSYEDIEEAYAKIKRGVMRHD